MFGLYELLTLCAFYTLGYNAAFYAILGILVHDIAYRINTEAAICAGLIGLYLINIFGVINTVLFVVTIIACIAWRDILEFLSTQLDGLRDRLQTTPQGQRLLAAVVTIISFVTMLFNAISNNAYIQPFMTSQRWIDLGRSIRDGGYESHISLYSFTGTMIHEPILEKGGVRAERILGCWFVVRREIVTFITINRVKLAQGLISAKSYAPMILEFAKSYANKSITTENKKQPQIKTNVNNKTNSIPCQSDTMDLMRDFIETKEAEVSEPIVPVQSAAIKREQRQAVQSAMMAPASQDTKDTLKDTIRDHLPENAGEIRKMVLQAFASKGIIWANESASSRCKHINSFNALLKKMNVDLGPGVLAKILNSK
jgi:hypothetical protein